MRIFIDIVSLALDVASFYCTYLVISRLLDLLSPSMRRVVYLSALAFILSFGSQLIDRELLGGVWP